MPRALPLLLASLLAFACTRTPAPAPDAAPALTASAARRALAAVGPATSAAPATRARGCRLHLVGDSTLASEAAERFPETGWGEALMHLATPSLEVDNHAVNGRSSKSFRDEGLWQALLEEVRAGDYVLIQFGHNDEKQQDPTRYAAARTDYRSNLIRFVAELRARSVQPLLATPICRRKFDTRGRPLPTHGEYPAVVRRVAEQLGVPLIDMQARTRELLSELGEADSKAAYLHVPSGRYPAYPQGKTDDTHLSEGGARLVAELFVAALKDQGHPLAARFHSTLLAAGATPEALPLWRTVPPVQALRKGQERTANERLYDVRVPALLPVLARERGSAQQTAIVVFPGGGYRKLSWIKEGTRVAAWLNTIGVHAFVVKYRLDTFGAPAPLLDARRAVQWVRSRAEAYGIDPRRIGVLGFSAGGHLAATLSQHFDERLLPGGAGLTGISEPKDALSAVGARPDFALLLYPVIQLSGPDAHQDSLRALLGEAPTNASLSFYAPALRARRDSPPTLLVHGGNDASVPFGNSVAYERALKAAQVESLLIRYENDHHGFGLDSEAGSHSWTVRAASWLREHSWVE